MLQPKRRNPLARKVAKLEAATENQRAINLKTLEILRAMAITLDRRQATLPPAALQPLFGKESAAQ
jgi:hypothetical protein